MNVEWQLEVGSGVCVFVCVWMSSVQKDWIHYYRFIGNMETEEQPNDSMHKWVNRNMKYQCYNHPIQWHSNAWTETNGPFSLKRAYQTLIPILTNNEYIILF